MRVRRHPVLSLITLMGVVVLHAILCYPAATDRGWSPYHVLPYYWTYLAPYVSFLLIGLSSLFDDFADFPHLRRMREKCLIAISGVMTVVLAIMFANQKSGVPSTGSLAGVRGVLKLYWGDIVFHSILALPIVVVFVICWDRACAAFWNLFRKFDSDATV